MKGCPVVNNVCIFGDSTKSYVVAVVCPDPSQLKSLDNKYNKAHLTFQEQCQVGWTGKVKRESAPIVFKKGRVKF